MSECRTQTAPNGSIRLKTERFDWFQRASHLAKFSSAYSDANTSTALEHLSGRDLHLAPQDRTSKIEKNKIVIQFFYFLVLTKDMDKTAFLIRARH